MKHVKTFEALSIEDLYKYSKIISDETKEDWHRVFQTLFPLLIDKNDYEWLYAGIVDKSPDQWEMEEETGLLHIHGDFDLPSSYKIENFGSVKFGVIGGSFKVKNNQLVSLKGGPTQVNGDFQVQNNKIKSLEGSPRIVKNDFVVDDNEIDSLEGSPDKVRSYRCSNNKNLKSLKGVTNNLVRDLVFSNCSLESLEHLSITKTERLISLDVSDNNIKDLKGIAGIYIKLLNISGNPIVSLEGIDNPYAIEKIKYRQYRHYIRDLTGISTYALDTIFNEMQKNNITYPKAVALSWEELSDDDKKKIHKGEIDDDSFKKLVRFSKIKKNSDLL